MAPIPHLDTVVFEYGPFSAVFLCFLLALVYVGSLYVWANQNKGRDHPETIKQRFKRVTIICVMVLPFLWLCSSKSQSIKARNLFIWVGIRPTGLITATVLPLILTMILFAGPLSLHYLDGIFRIYKDPKYWMTNMKNLMWVRNHIVAPLTEEYMFRACMLALLVPAMGEQLSTFICPLFFGVAHFHHLIEKLREGQDVQQAVLQSVFQFSYTTVFGAYSAFLFLRTGHLMAPVIAHAFCNHMGFPNFQEVFAYKNPTRAYIIAAFVSGLLLWCWLLYPLTLPSLYGNELYEL